MAENGTARTHGSRAYTWAAGIGLAGFALLIAAGAGHRGPLAAFTCVWVLNALLLLGTAGCVLRAVRGPRPRAPWAAFALAAGSWTLGNLAYTIAHSNPSWGLPPSLADIGYLGLYPAAWAGLILLVLPARERREPPVPARVSCLRQLVLDGVVAGVAVAALACALVKAPTLSSLRGGPAAIGATLAYPLGDAALLGFTVALLTTTTALWRGSHRLVVAALMVFGVADGACLWLTARGSYQSGGLLDVLWPAALLLLGAAAMGPAEREEAPPATSTTLVTPVAFTMLLVGVLLWDHFDRLPSAATLLALGGLMVAIARMALTVRENSQLADSRREALTDSLTGLGNRRALMADLSAAVHGTERAGTALLLFDLDGFKSYNDTFGHLAGDTLLTRLAHALESAMAPYGCAYRMGGDEFCALVRLEHSQLEGIEAAATTALSEHGEGFSVTTSSGAVRLAGHDEPTTALRSADRRLYADKRSRTAAGNRIMDVLLHAIEERSYELGGDVRQVATLAGAVAARLRLGPKEREEIVRAAQLHDVGKLGIPDEILSKPGPLMSEEWAFVRRHTQIGERLLGLAPNLTDVARLVRASHERFDGSGYPDGLASEDIPMGSRIIAACDAYMAMISPRPYRGARDPSQALAELEAGAGEQFDPLVVEALSAELVDGVGILAASPIRA